LRSRRHWSATPGSRSCSIFEDCPTGVEGKANATWILLDYITLVIHVFLPHVRDYYELERLWGDAPIVAVE